jgi:3-phytase
MKTKFLFRRRPVAALGVLLVILPVGNPSAPAADTPVPVSVLPVLETPQTLDTDEAPPGVLQGDSDDPAIWVHPTHPGQSLVLASLKNGGLAVFDLAGQLRQLFAPEEYGAFRYNNVDLVYNFKLGQIRTDIAVATDRANDTLVVFRIDPVTQTLSDITAGSMPAAIFEDDGIHTAYGIATYTSAVSGKNYAFVAKRAGNLVAQLELIDAGDGTVTAEKVRTMELPIFDNEPEDSQPEGMVADPQFKRLYVGMENFGVFRIDAEPDAGSAFTSILPVDDDLVQADVEGLTIYYGPGEQGYLLVSSQGNNSFIVLDRKSNDIIGNFQVIANGPLDSVEECDGADVINLNLGPAFPMGLLVVQDGDDDPKVLVEDDGELENIATSFKFVPWENVAQAFPTPLVIDTQAYNPRGTSLAQIERVRTDVASLLAGGELRTSDANKLLAHLNVTPVAIRNGNNKVAMSSLNAFQSQLASIHSSGRLAADVVLSLALAAETLESWLGQ